MTYPYNTNFRANSNSFYSFTTVATVPYKANYETKLSGCVANIYQVLL